MASVRDLYRDPFENYNLFLQRINTMSEIASKMNNYNSALSIVQQRMDTLANPYINILSTMDTVSQRLSQYYDMQPQIINSFERVFDSNSKYMLALQRINSIANLLDSNLCDSISQISVGEAFEYIDELQATLPELTSIVENNKADETSIEFENKKEISKERKKLSKEDIDLYLQFIGIVINIIQMLVGIIFSNTPDININITNDNSINYYVKEVNNTYVYNYGVSPDEYNSYGFRFVSEAEIMVRIKPDCSSTVVEKLKLGKIVNIVDKHKKWVQIRWKNEDDIYSYGWIQNYKLSEFTE